MKRYYVIPLFCIFFSCSERQEKIHYSYFDIKDLFVKQITDLSKNKPVFIKSAKLNGEQETQELTTINWKKELEPFVESDLNKPAFVQSYNIVETDSTLQYLLKTGEKLPISSILLKRKKNQISNIEIAVNDENMLYTWNKALIAEFEKGQLKKYSIKGNQKILIFEQENFHIIGQRK